MQSEPFANFKKAQTQLNKFLWSSELAHAIVTSQILTPAVLEENRQVDDLFSAVRPKPHALVPNAKGRAKYDDRVMQFRAHLRADLEALARYVIIRFHSSLEVFLLARLAPFIGLDGVSGGGRKRLKKEWQEVSYLHLERKLLRNGVGVRATLPRDECLLAQAHRMLRNSLVHLQEESYRDEPWSDGDLRKKIHTAFGQADRTFVVDHLCDSIRDRYGPRAGVSPLFFYALFSFTNYRNFAAAVEGALPL